MIYTIAAAVYLPRLGRRATAWAVIALWQAAAASVVASVVLAAPAFAVPAEVVGHGPAGLFKACAALLSDGSGLTITGTAALLSGHDLHGVTRCPPH
ncbi:hypothetical protein [Nonomuraea sp. C10]|uniref:hypothetical protein n=1 Tax=Nonomuraea sp. C10 TaxID=2600577 RepID=UPI0011CEC1BB|nr:hypothetical protein [Nonomuraea sp. C10]TXK35284.1 hypothetical protein FR742_39275 [Nonomuraea sp. C10]